MKINEIVHKIPETLIICVIAIGITILLVYFISTISALRKQIELLQTQQVERTEMIMKRAREERQIDMMEFFTTNKISCSCEE